MTEVKMFSALYLKTIFNLLVVKIKRKSPGAFRNFKEFSGLRKGFEAFDSIH